MPIEFTEPSQSRVYVATCGMAFPSARSGRQHEQTCHACAEIWTEEEYDDEPGLDFDDDIG